MEGAKQMVTLLESFPKERFKHIISFKEVQLNRFKVMAGLPINNSKTTLQDKHISLTELKDMVTRTSSPLGLQKTMLNKLQETLLKDQLDSFAIKEQITSLKNVMNNKYRDYYQVGDKLMKPAGNPEYYERLLNEITGKSKESFLSALKVVFFGK